MKKKRVIQHLFFWISWLFAMSLFYGLNPKGNMFFALFLQLGISLPVYIVYTYLTVYSVLPVTLMRAKELWFILYMIPASFLVSFLDNAIHIYIFPLVSPGEPVKTADISNIFIHIKNMIWINVPLFMFASVKFIRNYSRDLNHKNELEKQNLEAELSVLMIQLQPHFLFNTLNNLYSLAVTGDSRIAGGLQKIIDLLKYMLLECNENMVELRKELSLIENYVELQKIRYDDRLDFRFTRKVHDPELKIVPMILFTFVENSFKHGSSPAMGKSFIHLELITSENKLIFVSRNSYPESSGENKAKGLGLSNVKRRLEFLYPGKHQMTIEKIAGAFEVFLEIEL